MSKIPSNASIRRALTTIKKANLVVGTEIDEDTNRVRIMLNVAPELTAPKKSLKRRLPKVKKVNI